MAVPMLECSNENNLVTRPSRRLAKRHYKKDSRFVLDLYTLTYDSHESLDSLGDLIERRDPYNTKNSANDGNIKIARNDEPIGDTRNSSSHFNRKPNFQSRLQDGKNFQSCFFGQQFFIMDDNQFYDETLSLPTFKTKPLLNTAELNSLPAENQEVPANVITSAPTSKPNGRLKKHDKNNNIHKNLDINEAGNCAKDSALSNINREQTRWLQQLRKEVSTSLKKVYTDTNTNKSSSPITNSIKTSLKKVGVDIKNNLDKSLRITRPMLTQMNSNQLKIIIDDLHAHIEHLNEQLMKMLTERDELHTNRDSLLNHIEDISAYLDANRVHCKYNSKRFVSKMSCTKNIISGLRLNRLTSYIRN